MSSKAHFVQVVSVLILTICVITNAQSSFNDTKTEMSTGENSTQVSIASNLNVTSENMSASTSIPSTTSIQMISLNGSKDTMGNPISQFPPPPPPPPDFGHMASSTSQEGLPGQPGGGINQPGMPGHPDMQETSTTPFSTTTTTLLTTSSSTPDGKPSSNATVIIYPEGTSFGDNQSGNWMPGKFPPPSLSPVPSGMPPSANPNQPSIVDVNNQSRNNADLGKSMYDHNRPPLGDQPGDSSFSNAGSTVGYSKEIGAKPNGRGNHAPSLIAGIGQLILAAISVAVLHTKFNF